MTENVAGYSAESQFTKAAVGISTHNEQVCPTPLRRGEDCLGH